MKRAPDWRSAFVRAIEAHRAPFEWGAHDCGLLAADAILAVAGVDVAKPFRGRYASRGEARAVLHAAGYRNAEAVIAERFRRIPRSSAVVGDLAVIASPFGPALAPVLGAELAAFPLGAGGAGVLGSVPFDHAIRAYRIEELD